jgi:hypothetical protein
MRAAQRRQISLVFGWSSMPDYWRSRVPARNREIRTPRVGRSHFGGGGSGSRSAVPTYPQPPHKWTTSPDSGRTGGSLRASRIASPHWGQDGAVSGSFRTSIKLTSPAAGDVQYARVGSLEPSKRSVTRTDTADRLSGRGRAARCPTWKLPARVSALSRFRFE